MLPQTFQSTGRRIRGRDHTQLKSLDHRTIARGHAAWSLSCDQPLDVNSAVSGVVFCCCCMSHVLGHYTSVYSCEPFKILLCFMLQFIVLYVKNMDIIYCLNESSQYLLPIPLPPQRIWRLDVRSGFLNMITLQP